LHIKKSFQRKDFFFTYIIVKKHSPSKVVNAWAFYDWANSVYSLVITSTIFPIYYNSVTSSEERGDTVLFFGTEITNTVLYSYSLSFSFLVVAFLSPILSGVADYGGKKKSFLKFFAYLGSLACISLYFFDGSNIEYGIFCSVMASVGWAGSIVFYNAYLPEITSPDKYDFVSARGYAMGYIGSVLLLIFNLAMVTTPETFGISDSGSASRISFLMVGIWWAGFAQITFYYLPNNPHGRKPGKKLLIKGFQELQKVWSSLKDLHVLKTFLAAFFFYSVGVQTVMYLAASFGDKELNLAAEQLIMTVLIIQLVAIGGSYLFAYISKWRGNRFSLMFMVLIWVGVCFFAYFVYTANEFYILAFVVGLVMGGIQSLSRATYSKLIPANTIDNASYFSFYDVTEKIAIVLGTFSYGLIEQITGSMRNSTFALGLFFVVGLALLWLMKIPKIISKPDQ
jgi:MFS transporter, UMF1 family